MGAGDVAMPTLAPAMRTTAAAVGSQGPGEGRAKPRRRGRWLPALGLTTELGLADQAVRDLLDGHAARRLGRDPVQSVGELPFLGVHEATPPVISSARPGASRSRASALAAWDFTAPTEQPIAAAVWASVWSAK